MVTATRRKTPARKTAAKKAPLARKKTAAKTTAKKAPRGRPPAEAKKASPKKAKKAPATFVVDQHVKFVGYSDENTDQLFEPGTELVIVDVSKENDGTKDIELYACVPADSIDEYRADPEGVEGQQLIASEIKTIRRGTGVKMAEKPIEVKDIGELKKIMKKGDPTEVAKQLLAESERSIFYFAGVLAHIFHEKLYLESYPGEEGFDEYCRENFGFGKRKGRYYVDMYVKYSGIAGFDPEKIEHVGWSKAAECARYVTEDNVTDILDMAENTPIRELKQKLKEEYTTAGGLTPSGKPASRQSTRISKTSYNFTLYEDKAEGVTTVLNAARKMWNDANEDEIFERIVMQWASDHLDETIAKRAERAVSKKRRELKKAGVDITPSLEAEEQLAA